MYEMRQQKIKELQQKKWFSYALLAVAIFIFSQGSSVIKESMGYALPAILLSFILHARGAGILAEKLLKIKASAAAPAIMLLVLSATAVFCSFVKINIIIILLLDLAAIALYFVTAYICSKFKTGEK